MNIDEHINNARVALSSNMIMPYGESYSMMIKLNKGDVTLNVARIGDGYQVVTESDIVYNGDKAFQINTVKSKGHTLHTVIGSKDLITEVFGADLVEAAEESFYIELNFNNPLEARVRNNSWVKEVLEGTLKEDGYIHFTMDNPKEISATAALLSSYYRKVVAKR